MQTDMAERSEERKMFVIASRENLPPQEITRKPFKETSPQP